MYAKCYICSCLGLLITNLSILFYLFLNLKKMRKIYSIIYRISAIIIITFIVGACSKTEEDISGPTIHLYSPNENDTINLNQDDIHINMYIVGKGNFTEMKIQLINCESKKIVYTDPAYDAMNKQYYTCDDHINQSNLIYKIDKLTQLELYVHAKNDSPAFNTVSRIFYVKP